MAQNFCSRCGSKISEQASFCPQCGASLSGDIKGIDQTPKNQVDKDSPNVGLNILSFLFPIVGWILWGVNKNNAPKKAHACAVAAWIGFGIGLIINTILFSL